MNSYLTGNDIHGLPSYTPAASALATDSSSSNDGPQGVTAQGPGVATTAIGSFPAGSYPAGNNFPNTAGWRPAVPALTNGPYPAANSFSSMTNWGPVAPSPTMAASGPAMAPPGPTTSAPVAAVAPHGSTMPPPNPIVATPFATMTPYSPTKYRYRYTGSDTRPLVVQGPAISASVMREHLIPEGFEGLAEAFGDIDPEDPPRPLRIPYPDLPRPYPPMAIHPKLRPGLFQKLPVELQVAIFTESIQKPSAHTFKVIKKQEGNTWGVKLKPIPRSEDSSGYRYLDQLSQVCATARLAVEGSAIVKGSVKFPRLSNNVDVFTDLFVLELSMPKRRVTNPLNYTSWHPDTQAGTPRQADDPIPDIDRAAVGKKFEGMRKVAVTYAMRQGGCSPYSHAPFTCVIPGICAHPNHYKICPKSLAGYIDTLKDVETFYILIVHRMLPPYYKKVAQDYKAVTFDVPANERPDLEIFFDMGTARTKGHFYVEINRQSAQCLDNPVWGVNEALEILDQAKFYLNQNPLQGEWAMTSEKRKSIKTKVLVLVDKLD